MIKNLFFYYCLILVLLLTAGASFTARTSSFIPLAFLLPVAIYFLSVLLGKINSVQSIRFPLKGILTNVLLSYSFIVVTIMTLSGLVGAKNIPQLLSGVFFLPLAFFLSWQVLPKRKNALAVPALVVSPKEVKPSGKL